MTEAELRALLDECVRLHAEMLAKSEPYYPLPTRVVEHMRRRGWVR